MAILIFVLYIALVTISVLGKHVGTENFNMVQWVVFGASNLFPLCLVLTMAVIFCVIFRRVSVVDDCIGL